MKKLKSTNGFTLVELIVVIAILAILAGVAVPAYSGYIKKANDAAALTQLDALKTAVLAADSSDGDGTSVTGIIVTQAAEGSAATVATEGDTSVTLGDFFTTDDLKALNAAMLKSNTFKNGAKWTTTSPTWVAKP